MDFNDVTFDTYLEIFSLEELLNLELTPDQFLVEGLLPVGGTSLLISKPKTGKTTLLRTLSFAVASGEPFLGLKTKKGRVLNMCLEESLGQLQRSAQKLPEVEGIYFCQQPAMFDAEKFEAEIRRLDVKLVIIDTFAKFVSIENGDNYFEVTNALKPIHEIARRTNTHIMMVHHAKKSAVSDERDQILGSTAFMAGVDTAIFIKEINGRRELSTRMRYGEDFEGVILRLDKDSGLISNAGSRIEADLETKGASILQIVSAATEPMTEEAIIEASVGKKSVIQQALRSMVGKELFRSGEGKKGNPFRYSLLVKESGTENNATSQDTYLKKEVES